MLGSVYLIHFDRPISEKHTAAHYIGWSVDVTSRFQLHASGKGARLCQVAIERNIGFRIVRIWRGVDKNFERKLKDGHNGPKLCPLCCGKPIVKNDPMFDRWIAEGAPSAAISAAALDDIAAMNIYDIPAFAW